MGNILKWIAGLFTGGPVGATINTVGTVAVLAPVAIWFLGVKDDIAVSLTWGQIALFGLLIFAFIKIAHRAPPPGSL